MLAFQRENEENVEKWSKALDEQQEKMRAAEAKALATMQECTAEFKACEALAAEFTKEYAGPPPEDEPDEEDEDDEDEDEEEDDESRGGVKGKSSGKEEGGTGGAEEDDAAAYADVD